MDRSKAPLGRRSSQNRDQGSRARGDFRRKSNATEGKKSELDQKVLDIARVTRVTKGGKRFNFRATLAVGDGRGLVGVGVAKGRDVAQAISKATHQAQKNMIRIILHHGTIAHKVSAKYGSAVVILKPAPVGSGVKAGGPVRAVAKLGGIENISAKLISRTSNKINIARAAIKALESLKSMNNN